MGSIDKRYTENKDNIVCPACGSIHYDINCNSDYEMNCQECDKRFVVIVRTKFSTQILKD